MPEKPLINWTGKNQSYLLGVIHGNGHVNYRAIQISVGYQDKEYMEYLCSIIKQIGYTPRVYNQKTAYRIDIHNTKLAQEIIKFKHDGLWAIPENVDYESYASGVYDTDGWVAVPKRGGAKFVAIALKKSGNLEIIKNIFNKWGMKNIKINTWEITFNGKPYLVEGIKLSSAFNIKIFFTNTLLKNSRKKTRLDSIILLIAEWEARVPLWEKVANFIKDKPRDATEIKGYFHINKKQYDSLMGNIKKHYKVEIITSMLALNKYKICRKGS